MLSVLIHEERERGSEGARERGPGEGFGLGSGFGRGIGFGRGKAGAAVARSQGSVSTRTRSCGLGVGRQPWGSVMESAMAKRSGFLQLEHRGGDQADKAVGHERVPRYGTSLVTVRKSVSIA